MQKIIFLCALLPLSWSKPNVTLIEEINSQQSAWKAGINTIDDIESRLGFLGIHPDPNFKLELQEPQKTRRAIPETPDAREYWPQCKDVIGNIRNQGRCGSCWAFSTAEVMSDRLCIATNGTVKFEFSPEDLINCCSNCGKKCNGGYTLYAWQYYMTSGVVSGGDYNTSRGCQPYSASSFIYGIAPTCSKTCQNAKYATSYDTDKQVGGSPYQIPGSVTSIQNEILKNGPVIAGYEVYEDFQFYQSGVYSHISGVEVGRHAVKIIGWGTENGVPYWLVANSWGKEWAKLGGLFKIKRGTNECGIEASIISGYVANKPAPGSGVRVLGSGVGAVLAMTLFYLLKF
ncbi:cathepsin B-like cysteine proteinase 4 [Tribolium madens]|uniref:cathepsin B-like cysteine proteinase 4 n=1 Tax=Tribolium madens TaxID=41895 RepID=UPI001CF72CB5|nr:cathepsin B-like cysteine proteinase 4 [Tribolium madens]